MKIVYQSRPYELSYCAKLIEKYTGLIQCIDFQFGACNTGETEIWYLRDMTKNEMNAVQELFDNPKNEGEIESEILSNILKVQMENGKKQGVVTEIDGKNYSVLFVMQDEFTNSEVKDGIKNHVEICKSMFEVLKINDMVVVEKIDGDLIIVGKL